MSDESTELWFERREGGIGVGAASWKGRAAAVLYVLLVVMAVFIYSNLALVVVVVGFYTLVFGFLVAVKSDLMEGRFPPRS